MNYQDQTLTCRDCSKGFVFTARDQQFWAEKGFTNPPTRCRDCRNLRKQNKDQGVKSTSQASGDPKTLYKIVCKKCGKVGEMAIEPRKSEDVLCSECFFGSFKEELTQKGVAVDS